MTVTNAVWLADVLRAAGIAVVEHDGWKTRGHGDFTNLRAVTWHHDGSPEGDSPGVPGFMLRNWDKASANIWVDLAGRWHLLAAGVAYHAGRVLPGKPSNFESLGVETDHTTGETWSGVVLLDSLRRGTAAILHHLHEHEQGLHFHKTICSPPGRKTDPDGLDLATERSALRTLMEDDMTPDQARKLDELHNAMFTGVPGYGVPPLRDAIVDTAYQVAGVDLPKKPSLLKKIAAAVKAK